MLNEPEVAQLLEDLCRDQGYCLAQRQAHRFVGQLASNAREFATAVLEAEGLNPSTDMRQLEVVIDYVERTVQRLRNRDA